MLMSVGFTFQTVVLCYVHKVLHYGDIIILCCSCNKNKALKDVCCVFRVHPVLPVFQAQW